jgi:hypothetical protein
MRLVLISLALAALLGGGTSAAAGTENTCVITIAMTSGSQINNLDFVVNYVGVDAEIEGTPQSPDCEAALGGAIAGFHDDDAGHLNVAVIRLAHFSAPAVLAGCRIFYDTTVPDKSEFSITVTNAARDGEDNNVSPLPSIQVTKVECPGDFPQGTTTTTLSEDTTTTLPSGGRCGFPVTDGERPAASDALAALRAAVGIKTCALCVCDINSSGSVAASDALGILRAAVGIETPLDCPAC